MSMSTPFSASSVNAIVALVIVISFEDQDCLARPSSLSGATMATPFRGAAARQAASDFALRALLRFKDLHHFLGHYLNVC